jgi:hypothetical protein
MPGQEFSYEYDFGSTTYLDLKIVSEREVDDSGRSIEILARNEPPVVNCIYVAKSQLMFADIAAIACL